MPTTLEPRNGVTRCRRCYEDAPTGVKPGDVHPECNGVYVRDNRTVLGPLHAVVSTGNPLMDAALILEVDGWVAGDFVCSEGKKCLAGAVRAACGTFADPDMEIGDFALSYVKSPEYRDGDELLGRALTALAAEIEEQVGVSRAERVTARESPSRTDVLDVVTLYNDGVLAKGGEGRDDAIELLRAAARRL